MIGKVGSMERMFRVVRDPMTIIEVTRITLLRSQGQAGMGGITRSNETGTTSQQSSVKRGRKLQRQSTSQNVVLKQNYHYLIQ